MTDDVPMSTPPMSTPPPLACEASSSFVFRGNDNPIVTPLELSPDYNLAKFCMFDLQGSVEIVEVIDDLGQEQRDSNVLTTLSSVHLVTGAAGQKEAVMKWGNKELHGKLEMLSKPLALSRPGGAARNVPFDQLGRLLDGGRPQTQPWHIYGFVTHRFVFGKRPLCHWK